MKKHFCLTWLPYSRATRVLKALLWLALGASATVFAQTGGAQVQVPASKRFQGEPVVLNFVNADIEAVSRAMGAILKQQFIVDPRVKGNISLYSDEPLSPREAYLNFLAALRGLGFTVVEVGGLFKVVPEADAKLQTGSVSVGEVTRKGDQILTQIFVLNHENANNLVPVLRPLISPNNTINVNPGNNSLVVTDYADNLHRIAKIIASMDVSSSSDLEVVTLKHAVASDIAALVQKISETTGAQGAAPAGTPMSIMVDPRSNSLLIKAANQARLASVRSLITKLDQPTTRGMGNIWVVYLKNADATKLAAVLRAAYAANAGGSSGASPGLSSPVPASPAAGGASPGANPASPATTPVSASAGPSTGGFIQADPTTNSLIITAPEPIYKQLRAVIDQLDSRRAQVYIESMIVKVDAKKAAEFGFQWQGLLGNRGDKTLLAAGTNFPGANNIINLSAGAGSGNPTAPGNGLNIGLVRNFGGVYTLASLAQFLESNTAADILSTPNLVALDNEEAKIVIGQNVPFITGQYTNTGSNTGATNPFQTIERKDVGLTLRVKPQIGEGGTVRMSIYQENSAVLKELTSAAGPTTDKSSIETTVVVDDGQIMVLGGLLKDEFSGGSSKVPGLGDMPLLGGLFRSDSRERTKTNLMVFLRPVVIRTQNAANTITLDRYDVIRAKQQNVQPTPSRVMGINEAPLLPPRPETAPQQPANPEPVPQP
ncbi:MAG: type II secretion system secretin GspD [Burkholderiales bacterium]